jgi:hypothetical protein
MLNVFVHVSVVTADVVSVAVVVLPSAISSARVTYVHASTPRVSLDVTV